MIKPMSLCTTLALFAAMAVSSVPALAGATLAVPLVLGPQDTAHSVGYSCDDGTDLTVQYINAQGNRLAIIPLAGEELIFVNVVSGSGARYVTGAREWLVKSDEARLHDKMSDAGPVHCTDRAASQSVKTDD